MKILLSDTKLCIFQICANGLFTILFYSIADYYHIDNPLFDYVIQSEKAGKTTIENDCVLSYGFNSTYVHIVECIIVFVCARLVRRFPKKIGITTEIISFFILTFVSDIYYEYTRSLSYCFILSNDMWGNIIKNFIFQIICLY